MDIGEAVAALKAGKAVRREGWNSPEQFVYYVPEDAYPARSMLALQVWGVDNLVPYRAYLALKTPDGSVATWAPSCSDTLATDWSIV